MGDPSAVQQPRRQQARPAPSTTATSAWSRARWSRQPEAIRAQSRWSRLGRVQTRSRSSKVGDSIRLVISPPVWVSPPAYTLLCIYGADRVAPTLAVMFGQDEPIEVQLALRLFGPTVGWWTFPDHLLQKIAARMTGDDDVELNIPLVHHLTRYGYPLTNANSDRSVYNSVIRSYRNWIEGHADHPARHQN